MARLALPAVRSEKEERRLVVRFRDQWRSKYPELGALITLQNEQRFMRAEARNAFLYWRGMIEQGYQAGVPDYVLPVAKRGFFGLWIELKRETRSQVRPEQWAWCRFLANAGHAVLIGKGSQVVCETLLWYVQGTDTMVLASPWEGAIGLDLARTVKRRVHDVEFLGSLVPREQGRGVG
jgi:hypothetical protein